MHWSLGPAVLGLALALAGAGLASAGSESTAASASSQPHEREPGPGGLPLGEPWAEDRYEVHVAASDGDLHHATATFTVVPPWTLETQAALRPVEMPSDIEPGEPVRLDGVYENTGDARIARVTLALEVLREGQTVQVIESENRALAPGEQAELGGFFTPEEPGRYELRASLLDEGGAAEEQASSVQGRAEAMARDVLSAIPSWVLYVSMGTKVAGFVLWRRSRSGG